MPGKNRSASPASVPACACELGSVLSFIGGWLAGVGLFSGVINLLMLTGSIFMLQVYDRVLTSRSVPTLVALTVIVAALYVAQGSLDVIRSRLLVRLGSCLEEALSARAKAISLQLPLKLGKAANGFQPVRDLDIMRSFLSSQGPIAILDMPWLPIFLLFVFMLHPWLGWLTTTGAVVLVALTLTAEILSRAPAKAACAAASKRERLLIAGRRNAEVLCAMGFADRLMARLQTIDAHHLAAQERASDVTGGLSAISRVFRMLLQSAILALGAWLSIKGEMSAGSIIAASIASSRALAPIELAIAHWKSFLAARESRKRLAALFSAMPPEAEPMSLPRPKCELSVEDLLTGPPNAERLIVREVSFKLEAGRGLGIVGPSAAGKSTLVRAIVGVWPLLKGAVRLDGAALDQWSIAERGRHIGYLPQDIELFDGTIAENIARFDGEGDPSAVVAAAQAAGVHDLILRLPEGYETKLGEDGIALSAGQRQRIALARALYREPFLVVLDEPNSNLDAEGETALINAIRNVRGRGGIIIVVTHRPSVIAALDLLAVIVNGRLQFFGPSEEVIRKFARQPDPSSLSVLSKTST